MLFESERQVAVATLNLESARFLNLALQCVTIARRSEEDARQAWSFRANYYEALARTQYLAAETLCGRYAVS